jgi:glucokinase
MKLPFPVAVCDIGGTNVRFAVVAEPGAALATPVHLATGSFSGLEEAFAAALPKFPVRPRALLTCAAGPVRGRQIKLTNANWAIDGAAVAAACDLEQGLLFNDFEAQALALPALTPDMTRSIGARTDVRPGGRLVLGPGTGLGTAALLEVDGRHFALASEAGHMSFGPTTEEDRSVWPHIDPSPRDRISCETLLCGPGLFRLYQAREAAAGRRATDPDVAALVDRAHADRSGPEAAAVAHFMRLLARFAGDMALAFLATGGVTFAGGMMPRLFDLVDADEFRRRFEDKAPYTHILAEMSTQVVVRDDAVLDGMAAIAAAPDAYAIDYAGRGWR